MRQLRLPTTAELRGLIAYGPEVGLIGGVDSYEIKVIFVPKDRIDIVRKLVAPRNIRVEAIEPVMDSHRILLPNFPAPSGLRHK